MSGIFRVEQEAISTLEASSKSLMVLPTSAPSKYGDEYGYPTHATGSDRSEEEFDDLESNVQNRCRSRRLWDPLP